MPSIQSYSSDYQEQGRINDSGVYGFVDLLYNLETARSVVQPDCFLNRNSGTLLFRYKCIISQHSFARAYSTK